MKPIYFKKYHQQTENSFLVRYAEVPHTYDQFHFHNEYELMYHIENRGTRFVGDSIRRFYNGDIVLVGPNIPHYWHSDDIYFKGDKDIKAKVVLVQFVRDFLGRSFFESPEMKQVSNLLSNARQGIQIYGEDSKMIGKKLLQLTEKKGWKKMMLMIEILCLMGESKSYRLLASRGFSESTRLGSEERISRIFTHMVSNYSNDISLEDMANMANMNKAAFCRYFKRATNKTFSYALNEIRIGFACKDLIYTDKTISEIAFNCGYMNVTYFNRMFKRIKKFVPQEYRNMHLVKQNI